MTKTEIINTISYRYGIKKSIVQEIIDTFLDEIKSSVDNDESVEIRSFGTFYKAEKKARRIQSPIAGREIEVEPRSVLAFKGSKSTVKIIKGA